MIKCIVIEDEINAQKVIEMYLSKTKYLTCLGYFESGLDVPPYLVATCDLIFLDIELPELNGLEYVKTLTDPPSIIVTTAYPDFAVEAFEVAVVDYLVKPFSYPRFLKAINRIPSKSNTSDKKDHLIIYADKTAHKVRAQDIYYIKSELDYVSIVLENEKLLVLDSLNKWEEKLSDHGFIRIHRSYLVNLNHVKKFAYHKVVINSIDLPIGNTHRKKVMEIIEGLK